MTHTEINPNPGDQPGFVEHIVGSDLVHVTDYKVMVFARHEMPDWTVREFCRVPIHFRGHKFYLARRLPAMPPYAFCYELGTWHAGLGMESNRPIFYDEDYVAERDQNVRTGWRQSHLHSLLFALYPCLGLCWSGFKERVLGPIGFDPVDITEASVLFVFGYFLLDGVFVCYFRLGFLALVFSRPWLLWLDYLMFVILPLDCLVRFGRLIRGDCAPAGFLEWLFRRGTEKANTGR